MGGKSIIELFATILSHAFLGGVGFARNLFASTSSCIGVYNESLKCTGFLNMVHIYPSRFPRLINSVYPFWVGEGEVRSVGPSGPSRISVCKGKEDIQGPLFIFFFFWTFLSLSLKKNKLDR